MKPTREQLYLYVKINFLILTLFVVLVLMYSLKKKGLPDSVAEPLHLKDRSATIIYTK